MSAQYVNMDDTTPPRLTTEQTRIQITRRTPRWNDELVDLSDATDFWAFAGAAANVVMQLSWPEVGYGVIESRVESGQLMRHPWKRARTTTQYLAVAILGTEPERTAFRAAVDEAHRPVRSGPDSPVKYNGFDRELQMWVAACLYTGFEDTYQLLHGPLTEEQAEHFYRAARPLGTTLQVTADEWPATRADFDVYWNRACERIRMDDAVRDYLLRLIGLNMVNIVLRRPFARLLRFLTIGSLPPLFRQLMGFDWTGIDQRRFESLFLFVSFVNRFLPKFIRSAGSYLILAELRWRIRTNRRLV